VEELSYLSFLSSHFATGKHGGGVKWRGPCSELTHWAPSLNYAAEPHLSPNK